ncbi:hypothetical protein ACJMK2_039416 [Sinanodonta woodiana]|uniref:Sulfotransferase domain-containing protein n=1 Tax=Sinanodonta woodiana TaxID=1069815 RepID=A0ABD3WFC8_SINWO
MSVVSFPDAGGDLLTLLQVDGELYPYNGDVEQANEIRASANAKARPDDIILCNYPKSGCHWMWEVIKMILQGSATTIPDFKENHMIELITANAMAVIPSPRVINTHMKFAQLPRDMIEKRCKIVLILRNPKDVAVSFYHHHIGLVNLYQYEGKWENYLSLFNNGKVDWGSFYDYVHSWEKTIHENPTHPIHVVYYEDMKADSAAEVRRLANFMGVSLSDDLIEAIAEKCSFQNMVKDKMGLEDEKWRKVWRDEKPRMYRKGEVGDWKNWFTVAQNEEFDRIYAERMANSKLKFRFTL